MSHFQHPIQVNEPSRNIRRHLPNNQPNGVKSDPALANQSAVSSNSSKNLNISSSSTLTKNTTSKVRGRFLVISNFPLFLLNFEVDWAPSPSLFFLSAI